MHVLQLLFKTSAAALLLGLCLTLRTGTAQGQIQNVISANLTTSQIDNSTGYVITLAVSNLISQCIVVKNTLEVSDTVFFPYGNFRFTSCLCGVSTRRFFWEIEAPDEEMKATFCSLALPLRHLKVLLSFSTLVLWDTPQRQEVISAKLTIDPVENSTNYYDVTVTVKSNVAKCIVVRVTLEASNNVIFPYGNFIYTACLCEFSTRNLFWEIQATARQKVISITLTVERTGNSDDYNEILGVTSHVPVYLVDPCATLTVQLLNSSTASERAFGQSQPRTFAEQNVISITLRVERVGNSDDYIVTLTVTSHAPVYLVVKATLEGSDDVNFPYGNFVYTACLCPNCSKNFFWDIQGPANGILIGKAEVVSEENICPSDVEISTPVYKVCSKREIVVTL
ncbi:hypothetical protein JEQ12_015825 [Ovis aries]|uniref:Prolactin-induced protein n=1 Tax=Ovis aries TaxID=9940 RepID=A0A836AI24_SHEEP|nr:hypothetical protein JEQ12_015825 [Ovis aries]